MTTELSILIKEDPVISLLMQEYALLQDKMDKIGSFRFTIKGWAITLATGTTIGALAASLPRLQATALVFVLLALFWWLERRQVRFESVFADRAVRIEIGIEKRLRTLGLGRDEFLGLIRIPGTANEILSPPSEARLRSRSWWRRNVARHRTEAKKAQRPARFASMFTGVRRFWWWSKNKLLKSDIWFYLLIFIAIGVFFYFQSNKPPKTEKGPRLLEISLFGHYQPKAEDYRWRTVCAEKETDF